MFEIVLGISCFIFVVTVAVNSIIKRKNGKSCSGDCSCCSSCKVNKEK